MYCTVLLAPVLLPAGTHCWHRLCRRTDKWNSTGIRFDSPTESIIPSFNRSL